MLYAAGGQFWGAESRPGGCRTRPQPGQPAPPAEAGRSPLEHSHEESSWCSWRPFKARARADGGWVCLACSTSSASGPDRCDQRGSACTRSEPRPLGAKCSVTLALERLTMGNPRFLFRHSVPQRKRPRSYWNIPTSDLPRASLFESESYFLLGPVGTLAERGDGSVSLSVVGRRRP